MGITEDTDLPSDEELTVQEVNVSASVLRAAAFHLGKACEFENNEFILCRRELKDPRKCINEGKAVTKCALDFFRKMKKSCAQEFTQYATCIDKSSVNYAFEPCRKTQGVLDKCVQENLGIERPPFDYYTRAHVHEAKRPRPPVEGPAVYPDATPGLPPDAEKPPAKYGSRYHFWW